MNSDSQKLQLSLDPRQSTSSFSEDDLDDIKRIQIKPSTELIADEYERADKNGSIYIFRGTKKTDDENTRKLLEVFEICSYKIPTENIIEIDSKKNVELRLKEISELDHSDKYCLIIIFLGEVEIDDKFIPREGPHFTISTSDVWLPFIQCRTLKHKPKVFIFQACVVQPEVVHDTHRFFVSQGEYDIPTEADMLIIYKKIEGTGSARLKFIGDLCFNIETYGRRDDIIGLVTHTDHTTEKRPLVISTLTRKFYIVNSTFRDHYLDIDDQQSYVMETISDLQKKISELEKHDGEQRKLKPTSSFRRIVQIVTNRISAPTKTEEVMQVDGGRGRLKQQSSADTTDTDSSNTTRRAPRRLNSPRPVPRKGLNASSKAWRP